MSSWRDTTCGALSAADVGRRVKLAGWADTRRDHGGLVFVDLRDYTGKVQLVINPERAADAATLAHEIRNEFVLQAEGEVVRRAADKVNPNMPTGEIEVQVDTLRILSRSEPLPFQIGEENVDEVLRLKYRWLDMRSDRMQRNLRLNHTVIQAIRKTMDELEFIDVWTPSMTKGTPEGARDFLVPVRLQPGRFFALAAVAAALQAALHGRRARPLLPDRDVLARRGSARRPAVRVQAARPRDVVRRPRGRARRARAVRRRELRSRRPRRAADALRATHIRRRDEDVRHRQARPPLRPRDPGRDRAHARVGVRRLRERRRSCATSSRRARSRAPSSRASRRSRRNGAQRASRTS